VQATPLNVWGPWEEIMGGAGPKTLQSHAIDERSLVDGAGELHSSTFLQTVPSSPLNPSLHRHT
jgi:hypothetical protein